MRLKTESVDRMTRITDRLVYEKSLQILYEQMEMYTDIIPGSPEEFNLNLITFFIKEYESRILSEYTDCKENDIHKT